MHRAQGDRRQEDGGAGKGGAFVGTERLGEGQESWRLKGPHLWDLPLCASAVCSAPGREVE